MEESYFSDKNVLAKAISILSTAGKKPVSSLQIKMSIGFARAGRLYDTIMEIPVIAENGGLEWLQRGNNVKTVMEYLNDESKH